MLGAVTVTVTAQPLTSEFISLLKGLAAHLALCLTHVRCKHDLEVTPSLHPLFGILKDLDGSLIHKTSVVEQLN